ncbi:S8 family serine peptidase [Spiroplasma tabanidicola]|uniref:S8 family peptidase n=1 Tax=Spiroplasma tabanidicola TaxID=324079 RepID=A0A6I6C7M2_9MOLU|nr:S8 family serine peptidase [Spiroplasma tabanidicola]QGS51429.1 S8 family peptidase [Spiroplasma tabanidicola]
MGVYNINNEKAINHKNKSSPTIYKFNKINKQVKKLIEKLIDEDFPHDIDKEGNKFFKFLYKGLPPKTSRVKMYKNTPLDKFHLNQKDIVVNFNLDNSISTEIIYKVSNEDFEFFKTKLINIIEDNRLFEESLYKGEFSNKKKNEKFLLTCLSLIESVKKINEKENLSDLETAKVVKIYNMYDDMKLALKNIGVDCEVEINNTIAITPYQYSLIKEKMPYIINRSIEAKELSDNLLDDLEIPNSLKIPNNKTNSAIIGVIDSGMNLDGDFKNFIDSYSKMIEPNGSTTYEHGNRVASLIIAHDELNDDKDNLGNFKIRYFEVSSKKSYSKGIATVNMDFLSKQLKSIIKNNKDIKVWNISLGALKKQVNNKLLSYESIVLDKLAQEYDCLFVVASGNYRVDYGYDSLCSPADSLNCISVGSVTLNDKNKVVPSDFSSIGVTLHCRKPEVSAFGGPKLKNGSKLMTAGSFDIIQPSRGTSFSAPKVSRIAGYLISNGYSTLEVKSTLINLAKSETPSNLSSLFGYIEDCNKEATSLKTTLEFESGVKNKYFDINLDNVENVSIAWANHVNSLPSLGEEYSITNFNVSLIKYKKNWKNLPYDKSGKNSYTPEFHAWELEKNNSMAWKKRSKYLPESKRRLYDGKYFTSHKKEYKLLNNKNIIKSHEKVDYNYAIRINRQELFNLIKNDSIKLGISIIFSGPNFKEEDFILNNESLIEIKNIQSFVETEIG